MAHIQEDPLPDVGVLVGRFQVPDLHEGHRDVLDYVCERHDKVIVFLGVTDVGMATMENPLDFQARRQMIRALYPEVEILYIKDMWSDEIWSKRLDGQIKDLTGPHQTVMLYGSRDSFIEHYKGAHPTQELEAEVQISGKEIRAEIKRNRPTDSPEWRAGAVWAAHGRYPTTYTTVDIAIFNEEADQLLLVKKPFEPQWRFPGGFAEPTSNSFEEDARREAQEETNLTVTEPKYIGSFKVDDWRYAGERDKIKTLLFVCKRMFGGVRADDDVEFAKWFDVATLSKENIHAPEPRIGVDELVMPNHRPLVKAAITADVPYLVNGKKL